MAPNKVFIIYVLKSYYPIGITRLPLITSFQIQVTLVGNGNTLTLSASICKY